MGRSPENDSCQVTYLVTVLNKLLTRGPVWFVKRLRRELRTPALPLMRRILKALHNVRISLTHFSRRRDTCAGPQIFAVLDLNSQWQTYDVAYFLAGAELYARQNGVEKFFLYIVEKKFDSDLENELIGGDTFFALEESYYKWRLHNVGIPLALNYPACSGFAYVKDDPQFFTMLKSHIHYPPEYCKQYSPEEDMVRTYRLAQVIPIEGFSSSQQGLRYIDYWRQRCGLTQELVTITIREYGIEPLRNSNIQEWLRFATSCQHMGFTVVFVPDTDNSLGPDPRFGDFLVFSDASWNLALRIALYESATMNFFTAGGPGAMVQLCKRVNWIHMKTIVTGTGVTAAEYLRKRGIKPGTRHLNYAGFDNVYQALVWEDDTFENIAREFSLFLENRPDYFNAQIKNKCAD